jgi:hypothetical protein
MLTKVTIRNLKRFEEAAIDLGDGGRLLPPPQHVLHFRRFAFA